MVIHRIEHIESTPGVCGGKPCIAGRRVTVQNIAILHTWQGWSAERIAAELGLTLAEVYAALSYYHDHREEIDRSIRDAEALAEEMDARYPSRLQEKLHKLRKE
jgi:uncharacterized protein (DUF433 family)